MSTCVKIAMLAEVCIFLRETDAAAAVKSALWHERQVLLEEFGPNKFLYFAVLCTLHQNHLLAGRITSSHDDFQGMWYLNRMYSGGLLFRKMAGYWLRFTIAMVGVLQSPFVVILARAPDPQIVEANRLLFDLFFERGEDNLFPPAVESFLEVWNGDLSEIHRAVHNCDSCCRTPEEAKYKKKTNLNKW